MVLGELLEAAVEIADVRRDPDDALPVQLEHDTERGVRGRMLRTEVENPPVRCVGMLIEVLGGLDVDVVAFVRCERVGHREKS